MKDNTQYVLILQGLVNQRNFRTLMAYLSFFIYFLLGIALVITGILLLLRQENLEWPNFLLATGIILLMVGIMMILIGFVKLHQKKDEAAGNFKNNFEFLENWSRTPGWDLNTMKQVKPGSVLRGLEFNEDVLGNLFTREVLKVRKLKN